jgi:hypothetical protein
VQLGNVTVVPETEEYGVLLRRVAEEIPLAFSAFNREEPRPYDPPHSLLITREKSQPPAPPTAAPGSGNAATYAGHDYTILYPSSWFIEADEVQKSGYTDTTIRDPRDPRTLLRIDVSDNPPADVLAAAMPVVQALRRQSGYDELALTRTTFNGYDAVYWEFVVPEAGVPLHKVDVFFINEFGEGVAVLTQAPAARFGSVADAFEAIRSSYSTR